MTKNVLFAVVLTVTAVAQEYSGPKCLGSYCLDRKISDHCLFNRIGVQPESARNLRCYEEPAKGAFLFFETFDTEPHNVADVLLSTFPNCMRMKVHLSSGDLLSWKTIRRNWFGEHRGRWSESVWRHELTNSDRCG